MAARGKYIVFEGGDGTGKSTQADWLQQRLHREYGIQSIQIHEPDGYEGSEELGLPRVEKAIELRKKIKDATIERTPEQNVVWFTEARQANWQQAMQPALKMGVWVVAARSYISTVAYQGYGEGVPVADIIELTRQALGDEYLSPDLELILTLNNEALRYARIGNRGELETPDTFESMPQEFQAAMQGGYERFAAEKGIELIDASAETEAMHHALWQHVRTLLD